MILIALAGLCILTVPVTGGDLTRLGLLGLRWVWLAPLALGAQVVITTLAPRGDPAVHVAVHLATYGLLWVFSWINRDIAGLRLIGAGTVCNTVAIVANGGVMPAASTAQRLAGLTEKAGFNNSAAVAHPHLLWLGDIIPVPGPLPNVLSVGDLIIFAGMLVLLHATCRRPRAALAASE